MKKPTRIKKAKLSTEAVDVAPKQDDVDHAAIALAKQQAEPPPPPITRQLLHTVELGDTVCYFADIDDRWEVVELRGVWLRAVKKGAEGKQSQMFLTDTMIPLELAQRLPRKPAATPSTLTGGALPARRTRTKRVAGGSVAATHTPKAESGEPKPPRAPRAPRAPRVESTATPAEKKAAAKYLEKQREEEGACAAIRATATKFPKLTREDIVEVAKLVGVNPSTASIQYAQAHKAIAGS